MWLLRLGLKRHCRIYLALSCFTFSGGGGTQRCGGWQGTEASCQQLGPLSQRYEWDFGKQILSPSQSCDCSPGGHLDCNLMREPKPELSWKFTPEFLTHRNSEIVNVYHCVKPLCFEVMHQQITNTESDAGIFRGHEGASRQVWPAFLWWTTGAFPSAHKPHPSSRFHSQQPRGRLRSIFSCHSNPTVA